GSASARPARLLAGPPLQQAQPGPDGAHDAVPPATASVIRNVVWAALPQPAQGSGSQRGTSPSIWKTSPAAPSPPQTRHEPRSWAWRSSARTRPEIERP